VAQWLTEHHHGRAGLLENDEVSCGAEYLGRRYGCVGTGAAASANLLDGRQYVVIASGTTMIAFALPST
jgi:hypothetical protein